VSQGVVAVERVLAEAAGAGKLAVLAVARWALQGGQHEDEGLERRWGRRAFGGGFGSGGWGFLEALEVGRWRWLFRLALRSRALDLLESPERIHWAIV
jgi:hypothetical protein